MSRPSRARPMFIDATSSSPRPGAPASGTAVRSFHDQVVAAGRLSTQPIAVAAAPATSIHADVRQPAPTSSDDRASTTVTAGDEEEHRRGQGDGDGDGDAGDGDAPDPLAGAERDHAVGQVGGDGVGIGRADAGRAAHEVDEPRQGGEGDERAQPTGRDDAREQRHGDVGDEGDDALAVGREQVGEPPHAESTEQDRPDHDDGEAEAHVEQPQHAADGEHGQAGRVRRRRAELTAVPPADEVTPQLPRAVREREELADRRHRSVDERAAGDEHGDDHRHPRDERRQRALAPAADDGGGPATAVGAAPLVDADDQLRVAGPPERRQTVAAVRLEVVHLGVADLAQLGDRAAPGEQRREPRDRPDQRRAPTPTPPGRDR